MPVIGCAECGDGLPAGAARGRPRRYCSRRCQARAYRRRRDDGSSRRLPVAARGDGENLVTLAIGLADELGPAALSVRLLADRAGLPVHVVYQRIGNRADLLRDMAEQVLGANAPAAGPGDSRAGPSSGDSRAQTGSPDSRSPDSRGRLGSPDPWARLRELARAEWALYRRHPWLLTVLATDRPPVGPAVLGMVDRVVAVLGEAGFDPASAYRVYLVLSGYVQGMALLLEREPAGTSARAWREATRRRLENTGRVQRRPWLAEAGRVDPDLDAWFEFGLDRMLAGLLS